MCIPQVLLTKVHRNRKAETINSFCGEGLRMSLFVAFPKGGVESGKKSSPTQVAAGKCEKTVGVFS